MKCPNCKSSNSEHYERRTDNGILGPGHRSWVEESYHICLNCGIHFSEPPKKSNNDEEEKHEVVFVGIDNGTFAKQHSTTLSNGSLTEEEVDEILGIKKSVNIPTHDELMACAIEMLEDLDKQNILDIITNKDFKKNIEHQTDCDWFHDIDNSISNDCDYSRYL